jgi:hypothetical protein
MLLKNKFLYAKNQLWPIKVFLKNILLFFHQKKKLKGIKAFRNKFLDKPCFIIGNGPSLTVKDLEAIKDYKSFASNSIFKIFPETNWRPDFYGVCDKLYYEQNKSNILSNIGMPSFYPLDLDVLKRDHDVVYLRQQKFFSKKRPLFSSRADLMLFDGSTVTYMLIQLAVYMGFKKIYLLGVDFSYSKTINVKGQIIRNNLIKDYFNDDKSENNIVVPNLEQSYLSYKSAFKYTTNNGIEIINLSRKSKLNLFKKSSIESLKLDNE